MGIISSRVHGILDYLAAVMLIVSPWLFNFYRGGIESWIPIALGIMTILMSIFTKYELGIVKVIPMPVHLGLDVAQAVFLAFSPILFGFNDVVSRPHLLMAFAEILVVTFSTWRFSIPTDANREVSTNKS